MLYVYERKITELSDCNEFPEKKKKGNVVSGEKVLSDISIRHEMNFISWKGENEIV